MMKTQRAIVVAAMMSGACLFGASLVAQQHDHEHPGASTPDRQEMDQDQMMEMWTQAGTPGKHHEKLARYEGKWKQTIKHWMEPGAEPMVDQGAYESKMILGGRYLEDRATAQMMGMDFEGRGVTGYDNVAGEYFSLWYDNMSTAPMVIRGDYQGDKLVMTGEVSDPMSPTGKSRVKSVMWMEGDDTSKYEMYMTQGGEEVKVMEITSRRVD